MSLQKFKRESLLDKQEAQTLEAEVIREKEEKKDEKVKKVIKKSAKKK